MAKTLDEADRLKLGILDPDPSVGTVPVVSSGIELVDEYPWTDSGNAERLVALHGLDLKFVPKWNKWLSWDGARWVEDQGAVFRAAKATARAMLKAAADVDDDNRRQAAIKFATKSESRASLEAMVALARHESAVAIAHDQLNTDRMLFNVKNGTIDLRTGKLRSHRRADLITRLAPVEYDSAATCPTWDTFLDRVMNGDRDVISYLQKVQGYALTADIREHILAFLFGSGRNGKSTYLGVVHAFMGDYATPAPRGLLFRARGERHPTELATLHGKRFVTCSEIGDGQAFDEALVKDLTGGDPVECRRMHEDFWTYTPSHKLFVAGNYKPVVRGDDEGIWRRLRLIPWLVQIPINEVDRTLSDKLRAELPGILRWAVEGCLAWQREGLTEPAAVRSATTAYREESDALGEFFRLSVVFEAGATIARKELREAYETHCRESGCEPLGAKRFASRLRERGVTEANVRQGVKFANGWKGVRLMSDAERAAAVTWSARGHVGTCGHQDPVSESRESLTGQTGNQYPLATHVPATPDEPEGDGESSFAGWLQTQGIAPTGGKK
jgi:putative DNA primase/helicase